MMLQPQLVAKNKLVPIGLMRHQPANGGQALSSWLKVHETPAGLA